MCLFSATFLKSLLNFLFALLILSLGMAITWMGISQGSLGIPLELLGIGILGYGLAQSIKVARADSHQQSIDAHARLRLRIDKDACMGAASCVTIAPKVFKLDDQSLKSTFIRWAPLVVLDENGADNETLILAAQSCPYRAIIIENEETNERVYP